jgi:fructokinase
MGSICAGQVVTQLGPRSKVSLPDLIAKHLD